MCLCVNHSRPTQVLPGDTPGPSRPYAAALDIEMFRRSLENVTSLHNLVLHLRALDMAMGHLIMLIAGSSEQRSGHALMGHVS